MSKIRTSIFALIAMTPTGFATAGSELPIAIYSKNANPQNPIVIQSPTSGYAERGQVISNAQMTVQNIPESTLSDTEELTAEDLKAMERIFEVIEKTNTIEEIERDDPLSGMSPDQRAFFEAMQGVMPMNPEQIRIFRQRYEAARRAENEPLRPDAQRSSRSIVLTLKPGEEVPTIRLEPGKVATLTFSDRNGNPWPILSVTPGDPSAFSAQTAGEQGESNILVLDTKMEYAASNMVVTLVGNPVPILLTLDGRDQKVIDYRTDVKIDAKGPNSEYAISESYNLSPTGDRTMIAFLDGIPPKGAEKRKVSASGVEAWIYDGQLYVRTMGQILSPAYVAKSTNVSGVSVFVLPETPVVLISQDGVLNTVSVTQ